jgi:glycosyltransferase involved in cell wall biosynthesis
MPKITIGMPVFNDVFFIEKALNSIKNQTFIDFEVLLYDDCSSDGSAKICIEFAKLDPRFKYSRNSSNIGISRNMKNLLMASRSEYFMWAANDDFWHPRFIELLANELDNNVKLVSVFCSYNQVNEHGEILRKAVVEDFGGDTPIVRLKKFIRKPSDGFGYGMFRRECIKGVEFPVWVWPNNKCPYNNIYPTLFYYLSVGDYKVISTKVLWFNLIKSDKRINHKIPFTSSFALCYAAYALRKINLVFKCIQSVLMVKGNRYLAFLLLPRLFFSWLIIPVFYDIPGKYKKFKKNEFDTFI